MILFSLTRVVRLWKNVVSIQLSICISVRLVPLLTIVYAFNLCSLFMNFDHWAECILCWSCCCCCRHRLGHIRVQCSSTNFVNWFIRPCICIDLCVNLSVRIWILRAFSAVTLVKIDCEFQTLCYSISIPMFATQNSSFVSHIGSRPICHSVLCILSLLNTFKQRICRKYSSKLICADLEVQYCPNFFIKASLSFLFIFPDFWPTYNQFRLVHCSKGLNPKNISNISLREHFFERMDNWKWFACF